MGYNSPFELSVLFQIQVGTPYLEVSPKQVIVGEM